MRQKLILTLTVVLAGGVAAAGLTHHSIPFTLENTGGGVSDARLRFHIDTLAVPGEDYFFDNISLVCAEQEVLTNGDFSAGAAPWKFYTNAPAPQPVPAVIGGEYTIAFGSDGSNTQLFQKDLVLPEEGTRCFLEFDACATGGPTNPGYGHNTGIELIKHGTPYTKYGLDLSGTPPNPEISLHSCNEGPVCGDNILDAGEQCDAGGVNVPFCDSDCTTALCGDGLANTAANEDCDDGNLDNFDGCTIACQFGPFCGDGVINGMMKKNTDKGGPPVGAEECDNGGGSVGNPTTTESAICDTDCTFVQCGDGLVNTTAGEQCDDGNATPLDGCDGACQIEDGDCEMAICAVFQQLGATPVPDYCPNLADTSPAQ